MTKNLNLWIHFYTCTTLPVIVDISSHAVASFSFLFTPVIGVSSGKSGIFFSSSSGTSTREVNAIRLLATTQYRFSPLLIVFMNL